ncbi:serine palmitoyltransferase [Guyanagaster necrorhizus]|uniref:serine C-palmitoyltransferase n=1 Tax=Guyanagaster necrorhizus TaxID=856835 RepID=A0A9P7VQX8_9AGAR|nr:serine palmitoyltransferase [Guyanagaster necrorhizus MCA 3950]KAG7445269.1 serine palmitoyltransferase [Guyanagaster necrorhizus MCA 3950]
MASTATPLEPIFSFVVESLLALERAFYSLPGSGIIERYIRSSHQNDPGRTLLELILVVLVIRTLLQSRTRADRTGKSFIKFSDKEVDELVDEWVPEPLSLPLTSQEELELSSVPVVVGQSGPKPKLAATGKVAVSLSGLNFTGLAGNEHIKAKAIEALRKYGVGSCGPAGFYGTTDAHLALERDIADFLGTETAILYSQGFSTITSVIPAFCKRGDIIVADRGVSFPIQKAMQISRSIIRWYDHNDLQSLEEVLQGIEKERKKKRGPLTRRFIVTEGIFEKDGLMVDLPKLIELKLKYKYRLILDESYSFGIVGRTGRGLTELYNVPASKVDMLLGSVAIGLCAAGGFCAGTEFVTEHQRINGLGFVFSASMPPLLSVSGSEGINILRSSPSIFESLQENVRAARAILDRVDCITIPSHPASPMIHIQIRSPSVPTLHPSAAAHLSLKPSNPSFILPKDASNWDWDVETEEVLLHEVVEEALSQGVMIAKAQRLRGQEMVEVRPSIRLAMTSTLTKKETEKAVGIVKASLVKVLGKRRL